MEDDSIRRMRLRPKINTKPPKKIGFLRIWRKIRDEILRRGSSMKLIEEDDSSPKELANLITNVEHLGKKGDGVGKSKEEIHDILLRASLLTREFNDKFSHHDGEGRIKY